MAPDSIYGHCACNVTGCDCTYRYSTTGGTASNQTWYYVEVEPEVEFSLAEFLKAIKADWREWISKLSFKPESAIQAIKIDLTPILWRPALPRGLGIIPKAMRA